jgi:hypothetical protein
MQIPAGIILPSMAIGALYGRALGLLVQAWQKTFPGAWMFGSCKVNEVCVSPGLYAIAGAASALAGVTRLTGISHPATRFPTSRGVSVCAFVDSSIVGGYYVRVDRGFTICVTDYDCGDVGETSC